MRFATHRLRFPSGLYVLTACYPLYTANCSSLHPFVRHCRLDLDGDGLDVLLAGGAHRFLDDARELLGALLRTLHHHLVVHDVDDPRLRLLQTVVQQSERTLDDVGTTPLNRRVLAVALDR